MSLPGGITENDFKILEFIASRDMVTDPKTVSANLDIEHSRVKHRMGNLLDAGYLKRPDQTPDDLSERGLYEATELGKAYAKGDMTIAELRGLVKEYGVDNNEDS